MSILFFQSENTLIRQVRDVREHLQRAKTQQCLRLRVG